MAFGKRGLPNTEESRGSGFDWVFPQPGATQLEKARISWRNFNSYPFGIGQGAVTFVYHFLATTVLTIAILFISPADLTRFANAMTPYWPLLSQVRPYMDAHGHHQLFLYMSAMYFKDLALIFVFLARNFYWMPGMIRGLRSEMKIRYELRTLIGPAIPLFLVWWLHHIYYDPFPLYDMFHWTVFNGNIFRGIFVPAIADCYLVLFVFYSPFVLIEGGIRGLYKRMRTVK